MRANLSVHGIQGVHLWKEAWIFKVLLLILVIFVLDLKRENYNTNLKMIQATPQSMHAGGNIRESHLSLSLSLFLLRLFLCACRPRCCDVGGISSFLLEWALPHDGLGAEPNVCAAHVHTASVYASCHVRPANVPKRNVQALAVMKPSWN